MNNINRDLPEKIILKDVNNPLSAVDAETGEHVYKYSYNPSTGRLLYSYPGDRHAISIAEAGDTKIFDDYVRIIYNYIKNVAGSRGCGSYSDEEDTKSFESQYMAFKFFKSFSPNLKWIKDLTNNDLTSEDEEELDLSVVSPDRIWEIKQMENCWKVRNLQNK